MKKNTGIPYENLTQKVFQEILNQDSVKTIKVEHNVKLKGKTLTHQIDVYWMFEIGGIIYETVVQAKDWGQSVPQEKLLAFNAILNDLPGSPKGVFVTKTGYQKGAKQYAESQGITLYELREPTDKDWEGKIKTIELKLSAFIPYVSIVDLIIDNVWLNNQIKQKGLDKDPQLEINLFGKPSDMVIFDEQNNPIITIEDIFKAVIPTKMMEKPKEEVTYTLDSVGYISLTKSKISPMRITGIKLMVGMSKKDEKIVIDNSNVVGVILKDTLADTEKWFDPNTQLRGKK